MRLDEQFSHFAIPINHEATIQADKRVMAQLISSTGSPDTRNMAQTAEHLTPKYTITAVDLRATAPQTSLPTLTLATRATQKRVMARDCAVVME